MSSDGFKERDLAGPEPAFTIEVETEGEAGRHAIFLERFPPIVRRNAVDCKLVANLVSGSVDFGDRGPEPEQETFNDSSNLREYSCAELYPNYKGKGAEN